MTCVNPLYLVRPEFQNEMVRIDSPSGLYYREVSIKYAPHEFRVQHPELFMATPCGKCFACKVAKTREWSIRLIHETRSWNQCCFVTFTYDDVEVPTVIRNGERVGTLRKYDAQCLIKRLRKAVEPYPIKYYLVGEYGDTTFRPHYHAIIYGMSRYDELIFQRCWKKGLVNVGDVSLKSVQYVAGYVQKKLYGDVADDVYGKRERPFSLMSHGIGKDFCYVFSKNAEEERGYTFQGSHFTVPRYYLKKNEDLNVSCKIASSVRLFDDVNKFAQMSETELREYIEESIRERNQRLRDFKARERINSSKKL